VKYQVEAFIGKRRKVCHVSLDRLQLQSISISDHAIAG
jgi:hypothetical protein